MTFAQLLEQVSNTQVAEVKVTGKGAKQTVKVILTSDDFKATVDSLGDFGKAIGTKKSELFLAGVMAGLGGVPAKGKAWEAKYFTAYKTMCEKLWPSEGLEGLAKGQAVKKAHSVATGLKRAWFQHNELVEPKAERSEAEKAVLKLLKAVRDGYKLPAQEIAHIADLAKALKK